MLERIRVWWHPPKLHEGGGERRVSWLELFYDLVFVVIIARLAHYIGHHLDVDGVLTYFWTYALLVVPNRMSLR